MSNLEQVVERLHYILVSAAGVFQVQAAVLLGVEALVIDFALDATELGSEFALTLGSRGTWPEGRPDEETAVVDDRLGNAGVVQIAGPIIKAGPEATQGPNETLAQCYDLPAFLHVEVRKIHCSSDL